MIFLLYLSVFEDAVRAAGLDFHSDRLWDLYVEWEKEQGNMRNATSVLDRVLKVPTQLYNTHYDKCVGSFFSFDYVLIVQLFLAHELLPAVPVPVLPGLKNN